MPPEEGVVADTDFEVAGMRLSEKEKQEIRSKLSGAAMRLGVGTIFHPLQFVKILMQLGHEPMPLVKGRSWGVIGRQVYSLPSGFSYIGHIYRQDGFFGLYSGVGASLCGNAAGFFASVGTSLYLDRTYPSLLEEGESIKDQNVKELRKMAGKAFRESLSKAAGTVVCRPFQVIMIRKMAQIIGGETDYSSIPSSIVLIVREEGVAGLFKGLGPQLFYDVGSVWALHLAVYGVERLWAYIMPPSEEEPTEEEENRRNLALKMLKVGLPFLVNTFMYPYQLVSTVMAVNGSKLAAANIPYIPVFLDWQACWNYLDEIDQLKRGSKLFFRTYGGPISYRCGEPYAITRHRM